MKDIIRYLREYYGYSQEQFANIMNTSFSTVNRWENGHTLPNTLAQNQLFHVCREMDIDITPYLLGRIRSNSQSAKSRLILYHGSNGGIIGDIRPISRNVCDFGAGFYMGSNPMQPLTLISNAAAPVFYAVELNTAGLKTAAFEMNLDWALAIAYNRGYMNGYAGTPLYSKYSSLFSKCDLAIGPIADDKMFFVLREFFEKRITDEALINSLSALDYGIQYVALTEKACSKIQIYEEHPLSVFESLVWSDKATINREQAIIETNKILLNYRRIGRFFDEIMEEK